MRIISKFKDYYDSVWFLGEGELYVRQTWSIVGKDIVDDLDRAFCNVTDMIDREFRCYNDLCKEEEKFDTDVVIFCGEPFVHFFNKGGSHWYLKPDDILEYHDKLMETVKPKKSRRWKYYSLSNFERNSITNKFTEVFTEDKIISFHEKYSSPIISLERHKITLNPKLDDIKFAVVYDTNQAHQRLEMFISNFLFKRDDAVVPVGDDKVRIQAAGFDVKTSFRNM